MHRSDRSPLSLLDGFPPPMVRENRDRWPALLGVARHVLTLAVVMLCAAPSAAAAPADRPEFAVVARAVTDYFKSLPDHRPTDLVTQSQVAEALDAVADVGWEVPEGDAVVKRALADNSFLVQELSTPAGRRFMRDIARYPGTYTRLDRLSQISGGHYLVNDFIHRKGGYEMIEYMATTKGGHNMGKMMAATPNGVDLNKPTGRIYTADDLLAALQKIYAATTP